MTDSKWKDALWNLLDSLRLRRLTARVALSAGLLGLAAPSSGDDLPLRAPVSPVLEPETVVRKFKGRYVLRRVANALTVRLAQHRSHSSHSSHSSHASHSSHSSSSHYSGAHSSHFSSSPAPPPPSPPSEPPRPVAAPPKPAPILDESFDISERAVDRWRIGVLATPQETFDPAIAVDRSQGALTVTLNDLATGSHFSGYVSMPSFDLGSASIAVRLRRAAAGGITIFAAAIDAKNWVGFRMESGQLAFESHTGGRIAARTVAYSATEQRYLRLRKSKVAPVVVWETSADGVNWNPQYVETAAIKLTDLRIALSAGTTRRGGAGSAAFDSVVVERTP